MTVFQTSMSVPMPEPAWRQDDVVTVDGSMSLGSIQVNNRLVDCAQFAVFPCGGRDGFAPLRINGGYGFEDHGRIDTPAPGDDAALARLPSSVKALATLLERAEPAPTLVYSQALATSTYQLNTSAISTLIRVVDAADESAATALAVLDGQHRRLASYGWYGDWSAVALPAVVFGGLSRSGLLELLRKTRRRQRRERVRRPRHIALVRRLRGQLERLVNFIAPNAPPPGADIHVVAGVAAL